MKYLYFYQLIYLILIASTLPFLTVLIYLKKEFRESIHQRLAVYNGAERRKLKSKRDGIWIHASSVGEVKLVSKIPAFKRSKTIITTSTPAGKEIAKKLFPPAAVFLMPLDLTFMWKRFLKAARPRKLFVAETELWPGLVFSASLPKALFNGRMSDEKYKIYLKLGKLMKILLNEFDIIFARDKKNYRRFLKTGADKNKLKLLGNLKFLQEKPQIDRCDRRYKKKMYPLIVAGCTHRGEEKIIIEVIEKIRRDFPPAALIISPRHLKREGEVEKELKKAALQYNFWSQKAGPVKPSENIIIDSMGELSSIYSIADIVFIGGTFNRTGGHNVIEPAVWGKPLVVGPFYRNFIEEVKYFKSRGGLAVAKNKDSLYNIMVKWIKDSRKLIEAGENNQKAAEKKREEAKLSVRRVSNFTAPGSIL